MTRIPILRVGVHDATWPEVTALTERMVADGTPHTIAYANVHVLNVAQSDEPLRAFLNDADLCYCDGNGVRLGARILGQEIPERMTGADWIWDFAAHAEGRWRLYWIGGEPGVTDEAAARLRLRFPLLEIGTDHGFHARTGPEDEGSVARIQAFRPHVVFVGMGTPEQERWVSARRDRIDAPIVWCVGAAADYVAGSRRPGPRWVLDRHEWISRLAADPARLWRRYLVGNALFLARVARERIAQSPSMRAL